MKLKSIIFIYRDPLSEDQQKILKINFDAVGNKALIELQKAGELLEKSTLKHLSKSTFELYSAKFKTIADIMENTMGMEKVSDTIFKFSYPEADITGIQFEFRGKLYKAPTHIIPSKYLVHFIKYDVAKDMDIKPDTILYEIEETDINIATE